MHESDNAGDEEIERMADEAIAATDILIMEPDGEIDPERLRRYFPEMANKPPGYFEAKVRKLAEKAALEYMGKGEPVPPHVRSALGGDWQKPDSSEKNKLG